MNQRRTGVSPVVGIILLTAVTVALVSLAALFVFDVGQSSTSFETATVNADYESESRIDVQLLKQGSENEVIIRSALGTEYVLDSTGDTVTLLNQDENQTPIVLSKQNGEKTVLREIPPQSFTADSIVSKDGQGEYTNIQNAVDNAQDGHIIVLKKNVYYENIDVTTPNVTIVGETGTVIADNSNDNAVVDVQSSGVRISNVEINASSSQGGSAAQYGLNANNPTTLSKTTVKNAASSSTQGDITEASNEQFVSPQSLADSSNSIARRIIPTTIDVVWTNTHSGGNGADRGRGVAIDGENNVIVAGTEQSNSDAQDARIAKYNASGDTQWIQTYSSGQGSDSSYRVTVDSQNNILTAGRKASSTDGSGWRIVKYNASGDIQWTQTYQSGNGYDNALGITADSSDNVIVAGLKDTSTDGNDWRIVKYNSSGDIQWKDSYAGGNGFDTAYSVTTDSNDNVIVAGTKQTSTDGKDWRIVKYSSSGTIKWTETYGSGNGGEAPYSVTTDNKDNIIIAGTTYASSDKKDWRTAKYNASGSLKWAETFGSGNGSDRLYSVTTDSNNDIIVTGWKETTDDSDDWRIAKYNSNGAVQWTETYRSNNGRDRGYSVALGNKFMAISGTTNNSADVDWRVTKYTE